MRTLFVSDVHLNRARPRAVRAFVDFLAHQARSAATLYVLGDLFDEWLGDDDDKAPHPEVVEALAELSAAGVALRCLHGNHDFLLGEEFARRSGAQMLDEHTVVDVQGTLTLVMHGDTLCTRDVEYQAFRKMTRDPRNQRRFLAQPLAARAAEAASYRRQADQSMRLKPEDIMDVTPEAVESVMREHGVRHLVHGHTHRPAVHELDIGGERAYRVVLGDWYEQDSVLVWDDEGFRLARVADL